MSVTNYINNKCRYRIPKLDDVVLLIRESDIGRINIDNGNAYIEGVTSNPLSLKAYNITLNDTDALDERYKFEHTLSFSMLGYHSFEDFEGLWYVIVKDKDDNHWLVNPQFPIKVTYTYTLDANSSHTDFKVSTLSNYPTLMVANMNEIIPKDLCEYNIDGFKSLMLNESIYSARKGSEVVYTNDGFKSVVFLKDSAVFTETYDGENVSHSITFKIDMDSYKSSWHYNLLEFMDNTYAAVISTKGGKSILCGFHNGLQPSYDVNGSSTESDHIEVTLSDYHNDGGLLTESDVSFDGDESRRWVFTKEYGFDCIAQNVARYTLMKEVTSLGAETGNFKCLEGYEDYFRSMGLNIVGTFQGERQFADSSCAAESCQFQTTMPSTLVFNGAYCKSYYALCDTDWSITSSNENITVSPSSGSAGVSYTIEVCSLVEPTLSASLTVNFCRGRSKTFKVNVEKGNSCFFGGQVFDITANGQYVSIPNSCCIVSAYESTNTIVQFSISSNVLMAYVPENNTGSFREFIIEVKFCDGSLGYITINQSNGFEKWVKEGSECNGLGDKCDLERRYTGTTSDFINTPTNDTRYANCLPSVECGSDVRWVDTEETYCNNGRKYYVKKQQISYDKGMTWIDTGYYDLGSETSDSPAECAFDTDFSYAWNESTMTTCVGYDKYKLYIYQRKSAKGGDWEDVIPTRTSYDGEGTMPPLLLEKNSTDCGYVKPIEPIYEWRVVEGEWICDDCEELYRWEQSYDYDYICDEGSKYYKEYKQVSYDDGVEWANVVPEETRRGELIEEDSSDCKNNECDTKKFIGKYIRNNVEYEKEVLCTTDYTLTRQDVDWSGYTLTSVTIGECVFNLDWSFYNQKSLTDVDIPKNVRYLNTTFYGCSSLSTINGLENIEEVRGGVFCNCPLLTTISIPNAVGSTTFSGCTSLTSVSAPKLKGLEGRAFSGTQITDIDFPSVEEIDRETIWWLDKVERVNLPSLLSVVYSPRCTSLKEIYIPKVKTLDTAAFSSNSALTKCDLSSVETVGTEAFKDCSSLKSLDLPSAKSIGSNAFSGCTNLETIDLPSAESIGTYAFGGCNINMIDLPNVNSIGGNAFRMCRSLTKLSAPNVKSLGSDCFYYTAIKDIDFPNFETMTNASFNGMLEVERINLPSLENYLYARGCTSLKEIYAPKVKKLNDSGLRGNSALTKCDLSSVETIDSYAFSGCTSLKRIDLPSLKVIYAGAFENCTSLETIVFGESFTNIYNGLFTSNCKSLKEIVCKAPNPPSTADSFTNIPSDIVLYVPDGSVSLYENAERWNRFIIKPLSEWGG